MKKLNICFSNFKYSCLPTIAPTPSSPHHLRPSPSTSFFVNSLYDNDVNLIISTDAAAAAAAAPSLTNYHDSLTMTTPALTSNSSSDDDDERRTDDFSAVLASKRFFVDSSPGESNSIIVDSVPNYSPKSNTMQQVAISSGAVAIQTYSRDPYTDFRRSMQEMLEAHKLVDQEDDDWDYLRELLNCYLSLNSKPNHNFIIHAFSDLLVSHLLLIS